MGRADIFGDRHEFIERQSADKAWHRRQEGRPGQEAQEVEMNELAALKIAAVVVAIFVRWGDAAAMRAIWLYAAVLAGALLAMPEPATVWWYVLCAAIDAATALAMTACGATQMVRIIRAGLLACVGINIAAALEFHTGIALIYNLYPYLIGLAVLVELTGLLAGSTRTEPCRQS